MLPRRRPLAADTPDAGGAADRPRMAAILMLGALLLLSLQDSLVKLTSSDLSLWQFQFLRALVNLPLLLAFAGLIWGRWPPPPQRLWTVALRSMLLMGAMVFLFGGIPALSVAQIGAGLYVYPLVVALFSGLFLGERVGPRRLGAILAGFAGTCLMLRPWEDGWNPVALMPVGAAVCYAGAVMTTRGLCREEHPATMAFGVTVAAFCLGAIGLAATEFLAPPGLAAAWPYLFTGWHALAGQVVAIILACSCINVLSNMALARSYQSAESSWLAPFDYSYLVFATFWDAVMHGILPTPLSLAGMGLIAGGGLYVAWRERRESRLAIARPE
jgi:drug/metabolite transporter (DMT)-like permease